VSETKVIVAAECLRCKGSGWLERTAGSSETALASDPGHQRRQKRAGNFYVPRPRWFQQPSLVPGRGDRPADSPYREILDCFDCQALGKVPKEEELWTDVKK
jgi:hypothetical protein